MGLPESLSKKLNPEMLKYPCHISLFSALKTIFDAKNFKSLSVTESFKILNALSKQTRYEVDADVFLHPDSRSLTKSNKLSIFEEYFSFIKGKILQIINNYESSFYCIKCINMQSEDNGLFEGISPREYDYKDGQNTCSDFSSISNHKEKYHLSLKGFISTDALDINIYPEDHGFVLHFINDFNYIKKESVVLVDDVRQILKYWFKSIFNNEMPDVSASTKLNIFSCETKSLLNDNIKISKKNILFDIKKLQNNIEEIEKCLDKIVVKECKKFSTIVGQERKINTWIKTNGFDMPAHEFMKKYYPNTDPIEVLEMAIRNEKYKDAIDELQRNSEIGDFDMSCL